MNVSDLQIIAKAPDKLAHLADSLKKGCRHLFVVSPADQPGRPLKLAGVTYVCCNSRQDRKDPYVTRRVGPGNRIVFMNVNGTPGTGETDAINNALRHTGLKNKAALVAVTDLGKEGGAELARRMPQIDLIIGSGSWEGSDTTLIINGVLITRTGNGTDNTGKAFLRLSKGRVVYRKAELVRLDT